MNKCESIKQNNAGLSIVEIIIVLAIMAILGGIVVLSTSIATDKHVTSCSERIASTLEQTRSLVLGKRSGYFHISQTAGDGVVCQMVIDNQNYGDPVEIGRPGITITVTFSDGHSETLTSLGSVDVEFSRSNGSVINGGAHGVVTSMDITNGRRLIRVNIDRFSGRVETVKVN